MAAGIVAAAPRLVYAQPSGPFVRRDVRKLDPGGPEIKALRAGIAVMKARPKTDVTSWAFQANIHGLASHAANDLWRQCQHGQWWFFPWHRMYLYYFERILRKAIQEAGATLPADFALPYWNYSDEDAARILPDVFRARSYPSATGMDVPNPLFEKNRRPDINDANEPTPLDPDTVSYSDALGLTQFVSTSDGNDGFGGQLVPAPVHQANLQHGGLESRPHDVVHDGIGGLMGNPDTAANDPIFWLHHCNIDRLWNRWLGQNNVNPDVNSAWALQTFTLADENGNAVIQPVYRFLEYVSGNLIDYKYDDAPAAAPASVAAPALVAKAVRQPPAGEHAAAETPLSSRPKRLASFPPQLHLTGNPTPVKISVPEPHRQALALHIEGKAAPEKQLLIEVGGIDFDSLPQSGYYDIYLNLPEGETPSRKSKSYVGTLSTFALRQQAHADRGQALKSGSVSFPISRVLKRLEQGRAAAATEMTVTFVPRELPASEKNDTPRLSFRYVGVQEAEKPAAMQRKP